MKKIIIFLIFIISFSCKYNEVPKPEKMLSKQQMEDIMFDLAILNSARSSDSQILEENNIIPTQFLYKKYEIDSVQLAQNSIYYASLPDVYKEIIDSVDSRLTKMRDAYIQKRDTLIKEESPLDLEKLEDLKEVIPQ